MQLDQEGGEGEDHFGAYVHQWSAAGLLEDEGHLVGLEEESVGYLEFVYLAVEESQVELLVEYVDDEHVQVPPV